MNPEHKDDEAETVPVWAEHTIHAGTIAYAWIPDHFPTPPDGDDVVWWSVEDARRALAHALPDARGAYSRKAARAVLDYFGEDEES